MPESLSETNVSTSTRH